MTRTMRDTTSGSRETKASGSREAKARAIRRRVITAARDLFVERGYSMTAMDAIAMRAEVSAHSLRFTFASKRALLMEVLDVALSSASTPTFSDALLAADGTEQIRLQTAAAAADHRHCSAVLAVIRSAAAVEPEIAKLWQAQLDDRRVLHIRLAHALATKKALRPNLSVEMAADVSYALLGPEFYATLVTEQGWPDQQWQDWVVNMLIRQLLA